jgi:hypothetical protein
VAEATGAWERVMPQTLLPDEARLRTLLVLTEGIVERSNPARWRGLSEEQRPTAEHLPSAA